MNVEIPKYGCVLMHMTVYVAWQLSTIRYETCKSITMSFMLMTIIVNN